MAIFVTMIEMIKMAFNDIKINVFLAISLQL